MVEMVARTQKSLSEVLAEVYDKFGGLTSQRVDIHVTPAEKHRVLALLPDLNPVKLAGRPFVERNTVDGTKLVLSNGSWALIRPSGTEPLFRLYVEAPDDTEMALILHEVRGNLGSEDDRYCLLDRVAMGKALKKV
jgi:phosphomannomutase